MVSESYSPDRKLNPGLYALFFRSRRKKHEILIFYYVESGWGLDMKISDRLDLSLTEFSEVIAQQELAPSCISSFRFIYAENVTIY